MKKSKRHIDILVLSDIHLGTYGCHARQLHHYLKSIKPKIVVLNGDIIDIWQFSKNYWPAPHMKIIKHLVSWIGKGVKTYYITGNHDEMLRRFNGLKMGSLSIVNKLVLTLPDNKKAWIFHGDVFDITMQHSKWLAKLGAKGYDLLILINRLFNFISQRIFKKGKLSLSKKIKESVKSAVAYINDFENITAEIGISNKFDYVVCGHIHHPEIKKITNAEGSIIYMNSGDWVENLSSLEYTDGKWQIFVFSETDQQEMLLSQEDNCEEQIKGSADLFTSMLNEFNMMKL